jgi:hypothetical protein
MAKFPEPDRDRLTVIGPEVFTLPRDSRWWRIYFSAPPHPARWNDFRNYGPVPTARFDPHLLPVSVQTRSVLYAAVNAPVCLAEVFQDRRRVSFEGVPRLACFRLDRSVHVLDLRGLWPTRAGASQAVASGPRARSQRWARAVADLYDVEGVIYPSSMHGGDDALALWDCPDAVRSSQDLDVALDDARLTAALYRVGRTIGYSIASA